MILVAAGGGMWLAHAMSRPRMPLAYDPGTANWVPGRKSGFRYALPSVASAVRAMARIRPRWAEVIAQVHTLLIVSTLLVWREARRLEDQAALWWTSADYPDVDLNANLVLVLWEIIITAVWYVVGVRRLSWRGWSVPGIPWAKYPQAEENRVRRPA